MVPILSIEEEPIRGVRAAVDALRPDQCRQPIGNVRDPDFHFCMRDKVEDSSYCSTHRRINRRTVFKAE